MKFDSRDEFKQWIDHEDWYQTVELRDGLKTLGSVDSTARLDYFSTIDFRDKRVLDVGCNSGAYSLFAKRMGAREVVGVDFDAHRIAQARILAANEELDVRFEISTLQEAAALGSFDIVLCVAVLSEISDLNGSIDALKSLIGGKAYLEMPLARPLIYASISRTWLASRSFMRPRNVCEARQTKRGNWIFSPSLPLLKAMFGSDYKVTRRGQGVRYDRVEVVHAGKRRGRGTDTGVSG